MTTHANFAGQLCVLLAFYCGAIWETGNGNLGTHSETNTSGSSCTFSTTNVRARCSLSRCLLDVFQYSSESQRACWNFRKWEPDWERGCSAWSCMMSPSILVWLSLATPAPPPYRNRRVSYLRFSCQVACGGGVRSFLNGKLVGDRAKSQSACSFPLGFSSGFPPALQLFCGFALSWYCFLSVKSYNNGQHLGLGVSSHLHWPLLGNFGVLFPFWTFKFHTAFARTPPKIKFLILWIIEVHSLNLVFFWYFVNSSEYRAEKQTRRKALATYLPLAHSYD